MSSLLCSQCGAGVEPEARFCGTCGAKIPAAPVASKGQASEFSLAAKTIVSPPRHTPEPVPANPPPASSSAATTLVALQPEAPGAGAGVPADRLIGRTLNNRYILEKKIGEGGFGAVFQGKQIATGRAVAVKILHPHNVSDSTVVARFRREAEACSKLHNIHTVTIYDFDETADGVIFLAMELLNGKSLQQIQRQEGPLPPRRVLRILDQIADALGEAHDHGIIHRDMKPENVMIDRRGDDDFVKVLDFGIAKVATGSGGNKGPALTAVGQTVGTLEFMSPEQLRGRPLDGRSDIYAIGMMAYEMLTGQLPFAGAKNPTEIIQFHLQKAAPPPSRMVPTAKIPSAVDTVVLKMVHKAREDRYANTAELRKHIGAALSATDVRAVRTEVVRVVAVVGGLAVLLAAALLLASR